MNLRTFKALIAATLLSLTLPIQAEDIDLFVGVPSDSAGDLPSVLIILDNTGNWNTAFNNEKAALVNLFENLPLDRFNVGLMMFGDPAVGYVRAAIRPMDATNRPLYSALVNSLHQTNDRESARTLARTMSEAYRYLKGLPTVDASATAKNTKRDYTGNTTGTNASQAIYARPGNALSSASATTYNSPLQNQASSCAATYIIYIGNTVPSGNVVKDNTARNNLSGNELAAAGGDTTQIPLAYTSHQDNYADEWARFLKTDLGVITYTVDVDPTPMPGGHSGGMGNSALLESMANVSGGRYFRVNSAVGGGAEIADALNTIFSEIQSVNSVYASVSLPVSVNTQGTYLNQVFIGMFRPTQGALPRWAGNLKQYKLGFYPAGSSNLQTLDANSTPAINSTTGFITECARSFWTPTTADTYWQNLASEDPQCIGTDMRSNSPDGNLVEKGAQGYVLRNVTPASRTVYFENNTGNLASLTSNSLSAAQVGATDNAERDLLLNWVRGHNNRANDTQDNFITSTAMRPSVHGDVVHSRPVAINFGTDSSPDVRVFYGANDGMLRAINGNRNGGNELWSFLPREFYNKIKRQRDNTPPVFYPGLDLDGATRKDYGFDGPIVAYQAKTNSTDPSISTAWLYATMRRGGQALYALDVSNPATPSLMWRQGCVGGSCSTNFDALGQTWASPAIVKAAGYQSASKPLLLMGGGYDACEDTHPHTCTSSSKGNRLYIIDGELGTVVRQFVTERGIVADVTPVKDEMGRLMYGYTADMGGNVYRLSGPNGTPIANYAPADWALTRIASLGCDTAQSTCNNRNRKFLYAPDVVFEGNTYFLLLGSGDREKPLGQSGDVQNHFFMLKDRPEVDTWLSAESATCGVNMICLNSLLEIDTDATPSDSDLSTKKGWYLELNPKEQVVTSAITVFGTVTFSTHEPTPPQAGQCSNNLGIARVYNINYLNAAPANGTNQRSEMIPGGGLPPSPVAGMVQLDDGTTVPFIIGSDPSSPLAGRQPEAPELSGAPKGRVYWNLEE